MLMIEPIRRCASAAACRSAPRSRPPTSRSPARGARQLFVALSIRIAGATCRGRSSTERTEVGGGLRLVAGAMQQEVRMPAGCLPSPAGIGAIVADYLSNEVYCMDSACSGSSSGRERLRASAARARRRAADEARLLECSSGSWRRGATSTKVDDNGRRVPRPCSVRRAPCSVSAVPSPNHRGSRPCCLARSRHLMADARRPPDGRGASATPATSGGDVAGHLAGQDGRRRSGARATRRGAHCCPHSRVGHGIATAGAAEIVSMLLLEPSTKRDPPANGPLSMVPGRI